MPDMGSLLFLCARSSAGNVAWKFCNDNCPIFSDTIVSRSLPVFRVTFTIDKNESTYPMTYLNPQAIVHA